MQIGFESDPARLLVIAFIGIWGIVAGLYHGVVKKKRTASENATLIAVSIILNIVASGLALVEAGTSSVALVTFSHAFLMIVLFRAGIIGAEDVSDHDLERSEMMVAVLLGLTIVVGGHIAGVSWYVLLPVSVAYASVGPRYWEDLKLLILRFR